MNWSKKILRLLNLKVYIMFPMEMIIMVIFVKAVIGISGFRVQGLRNLIGNLKASKK